MAANSGVRVGWSASQVAFDPIMPLVVMVHKQMTALGHIEKMNSDIQGHNIAFLSVNLFYHPVYRALCLFKGPIAERRKFGGEGLEN